MSIAEYAAHRGVSDSYIRRMRRSGKLVTDQGGKRVDVAQSDALLDDITDPVRGGDRSPGAAPRAELPLLSGGPSVQEAVRRERLARARLAELELGEATKELTRARDVERAVFTLVRQALNSMLNMPGRLRSQLAAESDPRAVEALLDADIRRIAEEMQLAAGKAMARDVSAGAGEDD